MGIVEPHHVWHESEDGAEGPSPQQSLDDHVADLNAVSFSGAQMRGAADAIKHIQIRQQADIEQHGFILAAFVVDQRIEPTGRAGIALHSRIIAMDIWCSEHDPHGQTDVDAFFEAAGRQPLAPTPEGLRFDPISFREAIEFLADLPY